MFKIIRLLAKASTLIWLSVCIPAWAADEAILQHKFTSQQGNTIVLADFIGVKPVYLKFYATWCQPCNEQMPHFQKAYTKLGEQIAFIAVNINLNETDEAILAMQQKYNMQMPIIKDHSGQLASLFGLSGTPMHVLIDKNEKVIHRGHTVDQQLEQKLAGLKQSGSQTETHLTAQPTQLPDWIKQNQPQLLYFSATWCDWYLADSRPEQSQRCIAGQQFINKLAKQYSNLKITGLMSNLWTEQKDIIEYQQKFDSTIPMRVDNNNQLFSHFKIEQLPVLLLIEQGKIIWRKSDFNQTDTLPEHLIRKAVN
ncbi:redoxin domain-containing protein [Catenovulum sp. 2E275]|uniref:TlpA family protein disulfide reductase n=1 Tax=Catenovulum sp. 2E275 TaxID=2980497 RepID=UPI0021D3C9FD|nr:redoxin domain-containing protein [Catenovulum sp. 2E275]MCU4674005.1 redoxin domain-containing protein [Catenovulum sp. 2E275]